MSNKAKGEVEVDQIDSMSGNDGVIETQGDWDTETIIAQIHRELDGCVTPSMIQEVLDELIPKYMSARIQTFVPILIQRDAVKQLRSMQVSIAAPITASYEAAEALVAAAELESAARDIAAEGLAQGAVGAAELGAAMAEDAIAEEMDEPESST